MNQIWAQSILRCVRCNSRLTLSNGCQCDSCGAVFPQEDGIINFLDQTHPTVVREIKAVESLVQGQDESVERLRSIFKRIDQGSSATSKDLADFNCLGHVLESKQRITELLQRHPLPSGAVVLEIGADHCFLSNIFLDAGCRVIATDITDNMKLAPRADDPSLFRIKSDMNRQPVSDQSVNVVWATSAAHHSWDLEKTFQECFRILTPGGRLYFACEPMPSRLRHLFGGNFGAKERELGINETWIQRSKWVELCRKAGFDPQVIFPAIPDEEIKNKLAARKLPAVLRFALRPLLKQFQVSLHLFATRP